MSRRIKAILVMKHAGNIRVMTQALSSNGIEARSVAAKSELELLFESDFAADVALVDVAGFESDAWRMCGLLQSRALPFVVLSQRGDLAASCQSIEYGAMSILQKPVAKSALLQLIRGIAH